MYTCISDRAFEFNYCLKGTYDIKINNATLCMNEGDFAMIAPMVSHEVLKNEHRDGTSLVIVVGATLLSEYFEHFYSSDFTNIHFHLTPDGNRQLYDLLHETADLYRNSTDFSELIIRGNIYKICAYILSTNIESMLHVIY